MRKLKRLVIVLITILSFEASLAAESKNQLAKPDVRLLIDISGSMKNNDPNNLRIPALQLVTNLMPKGADAGVWAFGRYVNMMVPLGTVDVAWQDKAAKAANKISSAGLFTNIGDVLEKASYGWKLPNESEKRSMILLTDGMVDISKKTQVNVKERDKILNRLLPKLKKANVAIHTIALSQNADHELLKALSTQTDGWYQAVESAEELQKVFLKIFEQSTNRDSLPITGNQFNVDSSVEEMTLLVFKKDPLDQTKLIAPDSSEIKSATPDGRVRWFTTAGYDLITIQSPQTGQWQIDAKVDPDNRVMVVSKLGLNIAEVPNNLLAGEAINYQVSLLEDGEVITKPDFLNLVEARLLQNKAGQTSRLAMFFDNASHQFKQNFFTDSFEGVLNLTLEVKSPTFERTRNHAVNIYGSPLLHEIDLSSENNEPHKLTFKVREDIVLPGSLKVTATVSFPDGEKQYLVLDDLSGAVEIRATPQGGEYSIGLDVKGQSTLGRDFSVSPEPITFITLPLMKDLSEKTEPEVEKPTEEEAKPEEIIESPVPEEPEIIDEIEPQVPQEEGTDWMMWLYIGLAGNIVLVVLGIFGWKLIKKKKHQRSALMLDELAIEEDDLNDEENNTNSEEQA